MVQSAYVEFEVPILGQRTSFRVFETQRHLFLYVSQDGEDARFFNKVFEKTIARRRIAPRKKLLVFCRLRGHEHLRSALRILVDTLQGRKIDKAGEARRSAV